jgi:RNA polymerase sigma-70 factor (ECF subfamily)
MIFTNESSATGVESAALTDRSARAIASRAEALHDIELVRRFNAGNEAAFIDIMSRHKERVMSVAFGILKNTADAEEIVQDTFIRAHRGLARFRGDSSLATWLHRISMNLSRNRYWYFFRRRRHVTLSLDYTFGEDSASTISDLVASGAPDPAQEATVGEFTTLVASCMRRLGPDARRILVLRNSLDKSYGDIGRELGVNIGTVKSRIARARKCLRVLLSEVSPEFAETDKPTSWFETVRNVKRSELIVA